MSARIVMAAVGGGGLLFTFLFALIAWTLSREAGPAGPQGARVVEARAPFGPVVPSPFGEPMVYGHVLVAARRPGSTSTTSVAVPLLEEVRAGPALVFETADGPLEARLGDPMRTLKRFAIEEEVVPTLEGHPEAARVPGWEGQAGPGGFSLQRLALLPGQPVVLVLDEAGAVQEVWEGDLATIRAWQEATASGEKTGALVTAGLAVLSGLVAMGALGYALLAG